MTLPKALSPLPWTYRTDDDGWRDWIEDAVGNVVVENIGVIDGPFIVERANAALSQPGAQAVPERWKPINTAPRDGRWVWLWNKHASSGYEAQRFRWSTHYSVFGLGGCWTDGYGSTMGDGVDFDFWRETLPADFVPPASPATGGA